MTTTLPILPLAATTVYSVRSNSVNLTPTMGGPSQRFSRTGDRWAFQVNCRSLSYAQGAAYVASLIQGLGGKVLFPVPQPGLTIGSPGSPVVASGSGTSLGLSGFTSGYQIQAGQFFSLIHSGVRYLHQVQTAVTATGGSATLSIFPLLKVTPSAGDVCEFSQPYLEGFLDASSQGWTVNQAAVLGLSFSVVEGQ